MKVTLISALFLLTGVVQAQYLKIDNGAVFSSFSNENDNPILNSRVANYSVAIGLDYSESDWFSLSSQVGYMRVGGEDEVLNEVDIPDNFNLVEEKEFVHINTTFRPHLNISGTTFFVGIGPTLNILVGSRDSENVLYRGYEYNSLRLGGKAELGITHTMKKFRLGIVGGYLLDFTPTAESEFLSLYNHAFTAALTVGYRLR